MKKRFDDIYCTKDDDILIAFTVRDKNDNLVSLSGATSTFRIARRGSDQSLLELNNDAGISYSGSIVTVSFNAGDIDDIDFLDRVIQKFDAQLRVTIASVSMVSAYGEIHIHPLIE